MIWLQHQGHKISIPPEPRADFSSNSILTPRLEDPRDVHVWKVNLDDVNWDTHSWVLSQSEREKAEKLCRKELQWRSQRCRTALRCILATYLGGNAHALRFTHNLCGKPVILEVPFHFNVSHTHGDALIAVSLLPIGIDIEAIDHQTHVVTELISWVCHPSEVKQLEYLQSTHQAIAFYRIWTQKEAYTKAIGVGIKYPFNTLRFHKLEHASAMRVVTQTTPLDSPYYVYDLSAGVRAASVCLSHEEADIRSALADPSQFLRP